MAYVDEYDLIYTEDNDLHKKTARAIDITARATINEELPVDPEPTEQEIKEFYLRKKWAWWTRRDPARAVAEAHRIMPQLLDVAAVQTDGNLVADNTLQGIVNNGVDIIASGQYK